MNYEIETEFMVVFLQATQGSNPLQDSLPDLSDDCSTYMQWKSKAMGIESYVTVMQTICYGNRNPI